MDDAKGRGAAARRPGFDKRRLTLIAAAFALLLAIAGTISIATFGEPKLVGAAAAKAASLLELIDRRSPGKRTEGELTKTKHHFALPHERALPKFAMNFPFPPFEAEPALIDLIGPPAVLPASFDKLSLPPVDEAPPGSLPPIVQPPGSGPPIIVPPGSGPPSIIPPGSGPPIVTPPGEGPPVNPPAVIPHNPLPPPPPVPEPSTWMTMILGFALLGLRVRRTGAPIRAH